MIVSLAAMKTYLGLEADDDTYDEFLTLQLGIMSETVESYCRRVFTSTTWVQTFYRDQYRSTRDLTLFHYPVSAVASVVSGVDTISSVNYRVSKKYGMIHYKEGFFFCGEDVAITYTAGYLDADMPLPIKYVVMSLVQEKYAKKLAGIDLNFGSNVQSVAIPGTISIAYDYSLTNNDRTSAFGSILGDYMNILDPYRSERALLGASKIEYVEED